MKRRGEQNDEHQSPAQRMRPEPVQVPTSNIDDTVCLSPTLSLSEVNRALCYTQETTGLPTVIDTIIIQMCVSNLRDDTRYLMFEDSVLHQLIEDDGYQIRTEDNPLQRLQQWDDPDLVRMLDLCRGDAEVAFDCIAKMAYATVMQDWEDEWYYDTCGVEWLCENQEYAWYAGGEGSSLWMEYWSNAYDALLEIDYDHTLLTFADWLYNHSCYIQILINEDDHAY
jgi:hypothetical protein